MVMMAYSDRFARRGAITFFEFAAEMERAGFVEVDPPRTGMLHEFTHPDTGDRRYGMQQGVGDRYSSALERMLLELQAGRALMELRSHGDDANAA